MDNYRIKKIVIPGSVTTVETFIIGNMGPENITFLGTKEPKMISTYGDTYISGQFKGKVNVPLEYEPGKTTFLKREINRMKLILPKRKTYYIKRKNTFMLSNFVLVFIISSK